jgi:GH15 family glucan-1,4-alpha-glucosidase
MDRMAIACHRRRPSADADYVRFGRERRLTEFALDHLPGYEKSRPVRIGNAASEQFQLDVYGEVLDAMHLARTVGIDSGATSWRLQRHLVDFVEKHWDKPDNGLWKYAVRDGTLRIPK